MKPTYQNRAEGTPQLFTLHYYLFPAAESRIGTPEGTRTPDLLLRRQLLYPAELLAHICGAGDGNRTRVSSLEGWCSTIELHPQIRYLLLIQLEDFSIYFFACQGHPRKFLESAKSGKLLFETN